MPRGINKVAHLLALAVAVQMWQHAHGQTTRETPAGALRARIAASLEHLPDYLCDQVVTRRRTEPGGAGADEDRIRIEIAYMSGRELLASPGSDALQESRAPQLMPGGTAFSGVYASFLNTLVSQSGPTWHAAIWQKNDRRQFRCSIPMESSDYLLVAGDRRAIVGYEAVITVDVYTSHVLELEIHADATQADLGVTSAVTRIHYGGTAIGAEQIPIPTTATIEIRHKDGSISETDVRWEKCRAYTADSKIRFASPAAAVDLPRSERRGLSGLRVAARIASPVLLATAARGDVIRAVLVSDVDSSGRVIAKRGEMVTGRIEHLEVRRSPFHHALVAILFSSIETLEGAIPIVGRVDGIGGSSNIRLLQTQASGPVTYVLKRPYGEFIGEADLPQSRAAVLLVEASLELPENLPLRIKLLP